MIKDIKYSGLSTSPSDYDCIDGSLAAALNVINEDGSLKHIYPPRAICGFGKEYVPVAIHTVNNTEKKIILLRHADNGLYYSDFNGTIPKELMRLEAGESFLNAVPFGNTLVVSFSCSLHYLLWDSQLEDYRYLGTQAPEINLDFTLLSSIGLSNVGSGLNLVSSDKVQSKKWTNLAIREFDNEKFDSGNLLEADAGGFYPKSTNVIDVPGEINLKKGEEYKFLLHTDRRVSNDAYYLRLRVLGCPQSGDGGLSAPETIVASSKKSSNNEIACSIVADRDYSGISFVVSVHSKSERYYGDFNITGRLEILRGSFHVVVDSKIIEYTSDSFKAVSGAVNKFIAEFGAKANKFIYPFFARYAVRLFDGSYVRISPPVLLTPNSGYAPAIYYREEKPQLSLRAFSSELCVRVLPPESLENWKGIIAGIDIFVSAPIYSYNMGLEYDADEQRFFYNPVDADSSWGEGRVCHGGVELSGGLYKCNSLKDTSARLFDSLSYQPALLSLSPFEESKMKSNLEAANHFYKISSFDFEQISEHTEFKPLELEDGALESLEAKPTLSDAYLPYSGFASASLFSYNSRLNIFGSSYRLPQPSPQSRCSSFLNASMGRFVERVVVFLHTVEGDKCVVSELSDSPVSLERKSLWYFYPDNRAYRAVVSLEFDIEGRSVLPVAYFDLKLKEHPFLNGAYFYSEDITSVESAENPLDAPAVENPLVSATGSIYISEPNNPFVFAASLVVSGLPSVMALSSATQALSQGQFGQFPLYAFTREGIWALEISSDGRYISRHPVSRDVCSCTKAVTQIDSAVLFPSSRGLMILAGSSVKCISEVFDGPSSVDMESIPCVRELASLVNLDQVFPGSFVEYLADCRIVYDYPRQRAVVYRPDSSLALVYSLKSRLWFSASLSLAENLNSYPDALAVDGFGNIVDFSVEVDDGVIPGIFITRPLKLEMPDILKTMDTVIQRGRFHKGHVRSALYGSRDLINWHLIWSSRDHYLRGFRGSSYKYFRIACVTSLSQDESIFGASLQFAPRQTNQPR